MPRLRHETYTLMDEIMSSPTVPISEDRRTYQLTLLYQALAALKLDPQPTKYDWQVCSDCVNLMETLILEMKVCQDQDNLLNDATLALVRAGKRKKDGNNIRLDAEGIKALQALFEDYAELVAILPERVMVKCFRLTEKRIQDLRKGKKKAHDIEIMEL
jgi:hypothetical protein